MLLQEIGSQPKESPGELPLRGDKYPSVELKIMIDRDAKALELQEINAGLRRVYDIAGFSRKAAGFNITIEEGNITLEQNYFPIR